MQNFPRAPWGGTLAVSEINPRRRRRRFRQVAPARQPSPVIQSLPPGDVDVAELVRWAYAQQRVHHYLRGARDWYLWAAGSADMLSNPQDQRPVHHDAALVHEAVLQLDPSPPGSLGPIARLVLQYALIGSPPERIDDEPRPFPLEPTGFDHRVGHYFVGGERRYYSIRIAEVVTLIEDEFRAVGRKKNKLRKVGTKRTRWEVEYCPLAWKPDPGQIVIANTQADSWEAAMRSLRYVLRRAALKTYRVR